MIEGTAAAGDLRYGRFVRGWHLVTASVIAVCFVTQFVLNSLGGQDANTGAVATALPPHVWLVRMFSYFTIQSNFLLLIAEITLVVDPRRDGRAWRVLRLDSVLGIVITGLVFDLILARDVHLTGIAYLVTLGFHYFAPWAALLGWLLFGPRPRLDWATFTLAFIWPISWIAYTFMRGALTGTYPYPFLDVGLVGFSTALGNSALILLLGVVLALLLRIVDHLPTVVVLPTEETTDLDEP